MAKKKQFVVLGLGRFGMSLARELSEKGHLVLGADSSMERVQAASEFVTQAVCIDVADESAVQSLGLGNFDIVVVSIGSDFEASVMAVLLAKEAGAPYIVAKAKSNQHRLILERIGADRVIFPEREMGVRLANSLMYGNFLEFMEVSKDYGILEVKPLPEWVGKSLQESNIRVKYRLNVAAIRTGDAVDVTPAANRVFTEADTVVLMGSSKDIQKFLEK